MDGVEVVGVVTGVSHEQHVIDHQHTGHAVAVLSGQGDGSDGLVGGVVQHGHGRAVLGAAQQEAALMLHGVDAALLDHVHAGRAVGSDLHDAVSPLVGVDHQPDGAVLVHVHVLTLLEGKAATRHGVGGLGEDDNAVLTEVLVQLGAGGIGHVEAVERVVVVVDHGVAVVLIAHLGHVHTVDAHLDAALVACVTELENGLQGDLLQGAVLLLPGDAQVHHVVVLGEGEAHVHVAAVVSGDTLGVGEGRAGQTGVTVVAVVEIRHHAGLGVVDHHAANARTAVELAHVQVAAVSRHGKAAHIDGAGLVEVLQLGNLILPPVLVVVLVEVGIDIRARLDVQSLQLQRCPGIGGHVGGQGRRPHSRQTQQHHGAQQDAKQFLHAVHKNTSG